MTLTDLDRAKIDAMVDALPPLTAAQIDALALLLRPAVLAVRQARAVQRAAERAAARAKPSGRRTRVPV